MHQHVITISETSDPQKREFRVACSAYKQERKHLFPASCSTPASQPGTTEYTISDSSCLQLFA